MKFIEEDILGYLQASWSWAIRKPERVFAVNSMANILVIDNQKCLWRVCPEELSCEMVASNLEEMNHLFQDENAKADWQLLGLIDEVEAHFGLLELGTCYGMVIPAVLGGEYDVTNMKVVSIKNYLGFTGDLAYQIKDLPDGQEVVLKFEDDLN